MAIFHIEELSIHELIALLFLIEERKTPDQLKMLVSDSDFLKRWKETEINFRALVKYYPNEDEERFYFTATLEAVHGIDPYSDKMLELKNQYLPIIKILLKGKE